MRVIFLTLLLMVGSTLDRDAQTKKSNHVIELLPWEEVNELIPKYTKFSVRDIRTGKEFQVQRRAGSRHADVQPLTKKDTKIMKEIYQGKWSWKRRSIIVLYKDKQIAASMHGMPHGAGAIKNNFPGHFCIHFYGSTTHRRNFMDLSHKLMILKAAGKLETYLQGTNPYEITSSFIAGMKEDDEDIIDLVALQDQEWGQILHLVENVAITSMPIFPDEDLEGKLILSIPIEIDWHIKGEGRKKTRGEVTLVRFTPYGSWKIDVNHFLEVHF